MRELLGEVVLKSGETMRIEHVIAPDALRMPQIRPFLGHKPDNYLYHIDNALDNSCDDLETRFTIGLIGDEMVGNIMTVETKGVGVFGHVHTRSDQRRKGICSHIMREQMKEFRQRDGKLLLLGTGYQSAAYHIYASFGFVDWNPGAPGQMRYLNPAFPHFESQFFVRTPAKIVDAQWRHWSLVCLLAHTPAPFYLRSILMGVWGVALLEGEYCKYMHRYGKKPGASAKVLETQTGAVAAFATLVPDARWKGDVTLLDLLYHPNFNRDDLTPLLEAMPIKSKGVQCHCDPRDIEKIVALERLHFRRVAVLPHQYREGDVWRDSWLFAR